MGRMQREKGKAGERQAAKAWAEVFGGAARRTAQVKGTLDSPDIKIEHDGLHPEVKWRQKMQLYQWLEETIAEAEGKVPIVIHRKNNAEWLLTMRLSDAKRFVEEILRHAQAPPETPPGP